MDNWIRGSAQSIMLSWILGAWTQPLRCLYGWLLCSILVKCRQCPLGSGASRVSGVEHPQWRQWNDIPALYVLPQLPSAAARPEAMQQTEINGSHGNIVKWGVESGTREKSSVWWRHERNDCWLNVMLLLSLPILFLERDGWPAKKKSHLVFCTCQIFCKD